MHFDVGAYSSILMHCTFDCAGQLTISNNSVINARCRLDSRGGITIGRNVSVSSDVVILTADHDMNSPSFIGRSKPVYINDYVWIGTRAMLLPGVTIGEGAVVSAGAIVTKDVAPFTVVAGMPAKVISQRTKELTYQLNYRRLFQ